MPHAGGAHGQAEGRRQAEAEGALAAESQFMCSWTLYIMQEPDHPPPKKRAAAAKAGVVDLPKKRQLKQHIAGTRLRAASARGGAAG